MRLTCLACAHAYEVPEGTDPRLLACPGCAVPQAANFLYERSVRFVAADDPRYQAACAAVAEGRMDDAFVELEAALLGGKVDLDRAASDPALAPLRREPRWKDFVRKSVAS